MQPHPYAGQTILLASQHRKEQAIAPPFAHSLRCSLAVPAFDTDVYGTFTGEIARVGSQYDTLLKKARDAAARFGHNLVIASEGSFGPHPHNPWVAGGVEMMVFLDVEKELTIVEQHISSVTNYAQCELQRGEDCSTFLTRVGFPEHGLVLRALPDLTVLAKGVVDHAALQQQLSQAFGHHAQVRLETDMRAHLNPTRMRCLAELASQLAQRVHACCAECGSPGFGERTVRGQLSCQVCNAPTRLYQYQVKSCLKCSHEQVLPRPDACVAADPRYCDFCNP